MSLNKLPKLARGAFTIPSCPIIYLNIPKSACTTIKNVLYYMEHGEFFAEPLDIHATTKLLRSTAATPETENIFHQHLAARHTVFTFVRHPGRRCYSCFNEKIFFDGAHAFGKIRMQVINRYGMVAPIEGVDYTLQQHRKNFSRFLDFVADNHAGKTSVRTDAHWGVQTSMIREFQKSFVIDLIGRVESFSSQFASLIEKAGPVHMPPANAKFNEGPEPPFKYDQIIDDEISEKLKSIYFLDYRLLGYDA